MASRVISRVSLTHCLRSQRQSLSSRLSSNVRLMSSISSTPRVDLLKSAVDSTGLLTRTGSHVIKRSCSTSQPEVHSRIEGLVTGKPLVVFMKGTAQRRTALFLMRHLLGCHANFSHLKKAGLNRLDKIGFFQRNFEKTHSKSKFHPKHHITPEIAV